MLIRSLRELEDDIRASELRVLDCDRRAVASLRALRTSAGRAVGVKMLAGAGLLVAGWLLRRPHRRHLREARLPPRGRLGAGLLGAQRWLPIVLPLMAPLLGRKVALMLVTFGLPVAVRKLAPLHTMPALDLDALSGEWFEIARLPQRGDTPGRHDARLHYRLDDEGLAVVQRSLDEHGRVREQAGHVRGGNARRPGELEVSFAPPWLRWWPGSWDDHWMLYVDRDYSCALIGSPERDALRLLARAPTMPEEAVQALFTLADKYGFDAARVRRTPQG